MKVIFNADDYGYSRGANFGTIDAYQNGVVYQATIMANAKAFDHGIKLAKENPGLSLGVHLVLTNGKPLIATYKTLVDESGDFLNSRSFRDRLDQIDLDEVETEWDAQINKVLATGAEIHSIDTHHLINEFGNLNTVFNRLAKKYKLAIRTSRRVKHEEGIFTTDDFIQAFYGDNATLDTLIEVLKPLAHEDISVEVMTHPAYVDTVISSNSSYTLDRAKEIDVLTSDELASFIKENSIEITSFKEMA